MATWQIMKAGEPTTDPLYDDGGTAAPGDTGFSIAAVAAYVRSRGAEADGFNYVGLSPAADD